jgi:ribonuclease P protein component
LAFGPLAFGGYLAVLSAPTRLTRREDFATAVRRGRRAARGCLAVHMAYPGASEAVSQGGAPKVGFVVPRAVGGSVVRHRVQRRLRHLMRQRLASLPAGALVVVRALPASAGASSATLGNDLDGALRRLINPRTAGTPSLCPIAGSAGGGPIAGSAGGGGRR